MCPQNQKSNSRKYYAKRQEEQKEQEKQEESRRLAASGWKHEISEEDNMARNPETEKFNKNEPVVKEKVVEKTTIVENTQPTNPPKEGKMKKNSVLPLVVVLLFVLLLCFVGVFFLNKAVVPVINQAISSLKPQPTVFPTIAPIEAPVVAATPIEAPKVASTEAPIVAPVLTEAVPTEAPVVSQPPAIVASGSVAQVDVPTGPVQTSDPAPTCPSWNSNKEVTQYLKPGMTAIGDVKVNGEIQYDNGSGESTIVVNLSSKDVEIYAEWGSGCEWTTDIESVVNKQLYAGCGDANNDGIVDQCNNVRIVLVTDMGTSVTFKKPVAISK